MLSGSFKEIDTLECPWDKGSSATTGCETMYHGHQQLIILEYFLVRTAIMTIWRKMATLFVRQFGLMKVYRV
jgi:hypothetical protein